MKKLLPLALLSFGLLAHAQEGPLPTQALITIDSKDAPPLTPGDLTISVRNQKLQASTLAPVNASGAQIALLIDDGLRESVGRELDTLRSWVTSLPAGTEVFIGYMSNGVVRQEAPFTLNHAAAAAKLRLPLGLRGISASPYFCLSEFVKNWPGEGFNGAATQRKARFVMMLTNGVDPYNGSTSPLNQDSPYVATAQRDAQRAGVSVYSIYYQDAGFRGARGSFSGQSYLSQVSEATGGRAYYLGIGNPVSMQPFLEEFNHDVAETYIATFPATGKDMVELKVKSNIPHVKVRAPQMVRPGNIESGSGQSAAQ